MFVQTSCQRHQCTQTRRRFCELFATLGPRQQLVDSCEVRILNRVLRWIVPPFGKAPERIEIKADPRHAELLIKFRFVANSDGVNTPGERPRDSLRRLKL